MKLFVDANVLFTAAYSSNGKAAFLIENLCSVIITSDYAVEEARRNLSVKKPTMLATLEQMLSEIEIVASVHSDVCPIVLPKKDQPIFLAALKAKATHLLTVDVKDFGPHMNQPEKSAGIIIQTVAEFLASL